MEQIDFDDWLKNYQPIKPKYFATFEPESGSVISITPEIGLADKTNSIEIDDETAQLITEGKISLNNCFVDFDSGKFEIAEIKVLNKIDDVLHRVVENRWSSNRQEADFFITFNQKTKKIKFEISSRYNGTKKSESSSKRKIRWDGSTIMTFLITDYNDPNYIYTYFQFKIEELIDQSREFIITEMPDKFSVYTKRLFPHYVIEIE